jgi:hypothetical protein
VRIVEEGDVFIGGIGQGLLMLLLLCLVMLLSWDA